MRNKNAICTSHTAQSDDPSAHIIHIKQMNQKTAHLLLVSLLEAIYSREVQHLCEEIFIRHCVGLEGLEPHRSMGRDGLLSVRCVHRQCSTMVEDEREGAHEADHEEGRAEHQKANAAAEATSARIEFFNLQMPCGTGTTTDR